MTEGKHTPGPWTYWHDTCAECEKNGTAEYVIDGPPGAQHGQFSHEPDARLIAAAPELLAALQNVMSLMGQYPEMKPSGIGLQAWASIKKSAFQAIAKATGAS